jgi:hypothetical protein
MSHVRQAVKKGALASTTVFIVVSTIFSFLSIGVGSDLVLGSFTDLATTSDRKWVTSNIANNVNSMCNNNQDGVLPEDSNFTREFAQSIEKIRVIRSRGRYFRDNLVLYDTDGNAVIDTNLIQETGNRVQPIIDKCHIHINSSVGNVYNSSSGSWDPIEMPAVDGLDEDKKIQFRLFSGSYVQGGHDLIIQIRQEG